MANEERRGVATRLLWVLAGGCILFCSEALSDEISEYQFALNAYDSGDYAAAVLRLRALLSRDPPPSKPLLLEIHKYLGASYMFTGNVEGAAAHFRELLLLEPSYELDPVLFPPEVLEMYWKVKSEMEEEIKRLEELKKKKEKEALLKKEMLKKSWNDLLWIANNPPYVRQTVKKNRLFFAFVPFGAGQFQNEHNVKGWLFLSAEVLLLAGTIVTYSLNALYYSKAARIHDADNEERLHLLAVADRLSVANRVTFWLLIATIIGGLIDALVFFRWNRVTYEVVKESDVPPEYRIKRLQLPDIDIEEIIGETKETSSAK